MFCALLTSRYQVSVYRTSGPLVVVCCLASISQVSVCNTSSFRPLAFVSTQVCLKSIYLVMNIHT